MLKVISVEEIVDSEIPHRQSGDIEAGIEREELEKALCALLGGRASRRRERRASMIYDLLARPRSFARDFFPLFESRRREVAPGDRMKMFLMLASSLRSKAERDETLYAFHSVQAPCEGSDRCYRVETDHDGLAWTSDMFFDRTRLLGPGLGYGGDSVTLVGVAFSGKPRLRFDLREYDEQRKHAIASSRVEVRRTFDGRSSVRTTIEANLLSDAGDDLSELVYHDSFPKERRIDPSDLFECATFCGVADLERVRRAVCVLLERAAEVQERRPPKLWEVGFICPAKSKRGFFPRKKTPQALPTTSLIDARTKVTEIGEGVATIAQEISLWDSEDKSPDIVGATSRNSSHVVIGVVVAFIQDVGCAVGPSELDLLIDSADHVYGAARMAELAQRIATARTATLKHIVAARLRASGALAVRGRNIRSVIEAIESAVRVSSEYEEATKRAERALAAGYMLVFAAGLLIHVRARLATGPASRDRVARVLRVSEADVERAEAVVLEARPSLVDDLAAAASMQDQILRLGAADRQSSAACSKEVGKRSAEAPLRLDRPIAIPPPSREKISTKLGASQVAERVEAACGTGVFGFGFRKDPRALAEPLRSFLMDADPDVALLLAALYRLVIPSAGARPDIVKSLGLASMPRFAAEELLPGSVDAILAIVVTILERLGEREAQAVVRDIRDLEKFAQRTTLEASREAVKIQRERTKERKIAAQNSLDNETRFARRLLNEAFGEDFDP